MDYTIFIVRTDVNACDCTQGVYGHHKRVREKSLAAPGNRTCVGSMLVRCLLTELYPHNKPQSFKESSC